MSEEREETAKRPEGAGSLAAYVALGSAALYVLGYLSLRFQLSALGVCTDIGALDERYLFAGGKFLITLGTSVPNLLLLVGVLVILGWGAWRLVPSCLRGTLADRLERLRAWWSDPIWLALTGIVLSLALIQLVMRQCFLFRNLLLTWCRPEPLWLWNLLLVDELRSLYFSGLVAGTALTTGLLVAVRRRLAGTGGRLLEVARPAEPTLTARSLQALLTFLVATQFLLLAVNHGVMTAFDAFPRVADPEGRLNLGAEKSVWLAWEGHDGDTYLVRSRPPGSCDRRLITLPRKDVKKIEIIGYEPLLQACFFSEAGLGPPMRK